MKPWRFGLAASLLAGVVMAGEPDLIARQNLKYLLQHDCGSCHGMRLTGGLGPALTSSALERYPVNYVADTIFHGRGGTAMPAWRGLLTAHEARWLAEFLIFGEDQ